MMGMKVCVGQITIDASLILFLLSLRFIDPLLLLTDLMMIFHFCWPAADPFHLMQLKNMAVKQMINHVKKKTWLTKYFVVILQ